MLHQNQSDNTDKDVQYLSNRPGTRYSKLLSNKALIRNLILIIPGMVMLIYFLLFSTMQLFAKAEDMDLNSNLETLEETQQASNTQGSDKTNRYVAELYRILKPTKL